MRAGQDVGARPFEGCKRPRANRAEPESFLLGGGDAVAFLHEEESQDKPAYKWEEPRELPPSTVIRVVKPPICDCKSGEQRK